MTEPISGIPFQPRAEGSYTDDDYELAIAARAKAAVDARVSNADILAAVREVRDILTQYGDAIGQVVAVAEEVKEKADPVLSGLAANPMVKMLLGKTGR